MAKNRRGTELEILHKINNMNDEELKKYRKENKKHDDKIAQRTIRNIISKTLKRIIDILAGLVGTILLIPITIIVWIISKINKEKGSLFYSQERIGQDGKIFKMYKFRTMVEGADELLDAYLRENPAEAEEYASRCGNKRDIVILFKTFKKVFSKEGAI